jgi:DNA-binding NarL/FixJ family response regulator
VKPDPKIRIALFTQQPFVAQGLAAVLRAEADLELVFSADSLAAVRDSLKTVTPDVLLLQLMAGISLSELHQVRSASRCQVILWGQELDGDFAFQAMQLGVRGILSGSTSIADFLAALRNVHGGALCFEQELLDNFLSQKRVVLSPRQGQIVSLVAQGLKNKEIAFSMGITEGTVKVYLYKLFKKLGVNDRLDLALYGRKNLFSGHAGLERAGLAPSQAVHPLLLVARKQSGLTAVQ